MSFTAINPATEEVIAEYAASTPEEVEAALATASEAFKKWSRTPVAERARLMQTAAELLESEIPVAAEIMTSEMGKTFAAAKGEAAKCASVMRYYAEHAEQIVAPEEIATSASRSGVRYEPIGPIFAVMPWNFPLWQFIRFAAPNVVAGNVAVLKHASNVPGAAKYLEDLFARAGFPKGVVTSLFIGHDVAASIIADPRIAAVTLTGSEGAGRTVGATAGKYLKKAVLELGGSDPFIVGASADLDLTVAKAVTARVQNNGQACIASKRYIVLREVADQFVPRFVEAMGAVSVGDPMDPATVLGPLANKQQLNELTEQVAKSVSAGAVAHVGGAPIEGKGYYYPATVLTNVPDDSPAGCEELFGPVAVVHIVENMDEAIEVANNTPWGLGASVWATDPAEIDAAIAGIDAGMVFANAIVASMPELPFGGTKASGYGRELALSGAREFMNAKSFYVA
ncbi:MAG TPA: NAD-dependent succinate-semialdehyde dehydrogenase [Acidimicrobiales bacterium]|nr:NAD-dependent succinate-semialdehyde dehydrogenase [Acidimicrobiales bacterium]